MATGLNAKEENIKVPNFLLVIGRDCLQIYFQPDKNVIYEPYLFGSANQEPQENIEQYEGRLRHLSSTCDYDT